MSELLVAGGFRLRTAARADCARCAGRSRGTVSYNAEVAHCFRCGWKANRYQLARDLGLVGQASACRLSPASANRQPGQAEACPTESRPRRMRRARPAEIRELRRRRENGLEIRAFERWREERLRQVSERYRSLSGAAVRAALALGAGPVAQTSVCGFSTPCADPKPQAEACATETPAGAKLTPEQQELCWDALARFYHQEAQLSAAFDFLMCTKASQWLEDDARIEDVFQFWKQEAARERFG